MSRAAVRPCIVDIVDIVDIIDIYLCTCPPPGTLLAPTLTTVASYGSGTRGWGPGLARLLGAWWTAAAETQTENCGWATPCGGHLTLDMRS